MRSIGVSEGQLRVVAGHFPDATRFSANGGNAQGQFSVRRPGLGIFAKSHPVIAGQLNFDHVSLRIVPTFQDFWKALKPEDFVNTDEFGNRFMTFGAGTASGDSSFTCTGTLTKGINREKDVNASPRNLEQLPVDILTELRLIDLDLGFRLLRKWRFFDDGLRIRRHVIVIEQRPLAGRHGVRMRRFVDFGLGLRCRRRIDPCSRPR